MANKKPTKRTPKGKPVQKWQKKRNARLKFYNKTVKITRKELEKAGKDLTYNEARKFTSEFVYSKFKGLPTSKVKASDIHEAALKAIEENLQPAPTPPTQEFIDPRAISELEVAAIHWWDIDDFIVGGTDPNLLQARAIKDNPTKNLRFEVIASPTERTGELTLFEYDPVLSGVKAMIEKIREWTDNTSGPYFSGLVGKRYGKTDLNDPDTYILQFILHDTHDEPCIEPDEMITMLPQRELTAEEYEEQKRKLADKIARKDEIEARKEEIEKAKARKTAKRPTKKKKVKEPEPTPEPPKKEKKTRGDRVLELNEQKIKELEMLRKDLDDKIITKKEYKADRERIMEQYELALKKLKKGGIV